MRTVGQTFADMATPERTEALGRVLWWLWVIGTAALLVMAALAFVSSLNSASIDRRADGPCRDTFGVRRAYLRRWPRCAACHHW
jgi:hypothetical protein